MEDRETAQMHKYGESKTTRIMMGTVPHVTSGLGLRKFQADGILLTRVYIVALRVTWVQCGHHCTQLLLTLLRTTWWWPPQRPKHVVTSYLHHVANKLKIDVFLLFDVTLFILLKK